VSSISTPRQDDKMCYVIDSKQLLANVLRDRQQIDLRDLKLLAERISQAVPAVVVDLSHYSLSSALENYANMFERQGEITIRRVVSSEGCFEESFIEIFFNQEIPSDIRHKFLDCVLSQDVKQAC
jgi:hypothetical protein